MLVSFASSASISSFFLFAPRLAGTFLVADGVFSVFGARGFLGFFVEDVDVEEEIGFIDVEFIKDLELFVGYVTLFNPCTFGAVGKNFKLLVDVFFSNNFEIFVADEIGEIFIEFK